MSVYQAAEGLFAAPFTPMHPDGTLNLSMIPVLVEKMVADGLTGAFVCGSNGEGPSLTLEERMAVTEAFVQAAQGQLKIWVHVGHNSIRESQRLLRHARDTGADAASAVAAFYFKPSSVEVLAECMAQIAGATPDFPFYYYHIPMLTGLTVDVVRFLELAGPQIPNLRGIKYSSPTLWEYQACLNLADSKYEALFGCDEMLLPALSIGAKAAIGSTYNFAAPLYLQLIEAYRAGDKTEAQRLMWQCAEMVRIFCQFPVIPAQKAIMRHLGFDLGPCRLPLTNLSQAQADSLIGQLSAVGFFGALTASVN